MRRLLSKFSSIRRHEKGFLYAPADSVGAMPAVRSGETIRIDGRRPPWLVVDHELTSVVIPSRWPGRLWRVEVVDPVTDADVAAAGAGKPVASAGYVRAVAVRLVEELPLHLLFGAHGEAVCAVIAAAASVDRKQVDMLAGARHAESARVYAEAWRKWLRREGSDSMHRDEDLDGTLAISSLASRSRSPINGGLSVVHSEFTRRARQLAGDSAFETDEEGEVHLRSPWSVACNSMLDAALAFGTPSLLTRDQICLLATPWRSVFGSDPPELPNEPGGRP